MPGPLSQPWPLGWSVAVFVLAAGLTVVCTVLLATAPLAESLVVLTARFVGAVVLGVIIALPETVTAVAAVRRGAVTLAIAAIIGGDTFDALTLVVGDVAYRPGSLFHAAGPD